MSDQKLLAFRIGSLWDLSYAQWASPSALEKQDDVENNELDFSEKKLAISILFLIIVQKQKQKPLRLIKLIAMQFCEGRVNELTHQNFQL